MKDLIQVAINKGAKLVASISGGKDSQAMLKVITINNLPVHSLIHADLGRLEWKETAAHCAKLSNEFNIPLMIATREDGRDMLAHWQHRMHQLQGTGKPFWSSSSQRYCTSDLKRAPINRYFTSTCFDFIISCEGLRADESAARAAKNPFSVRSNSSTYYNGMSAEEAIIKFKPGKKLFINWYPIFNYTVADVWATYGIKEIDLIMAQESYLYDNTVPVWWPFHPAYVYGNDRLSCMFCVLGSKNDLQNAAKHNPELLDELIAMEEESGFTFKNKFSLQSLK